VENFGQPVQIGLLQIAKIIPPSTADASDANRTNTQIPSQNLYAQTINHFYRFQAKLKIIRPTESLL